MSPAEIVTKLKIYRMPQDITEFSGTVDGRPAKVTDGTSVIPGVGCSVTYTDSDGKYNHVDIPRKSVFSMDNADVEGK
jgi:hypothetical protein